MLPAIIASGSLLASNGQALDASCTDSKGSQVSSLALQKIQEQEKYQMIFMTEGFGVVEQNQNGAFIVYSRITPDTLLKEINKTSSKIESLDELKFIFLLGPTPPFFGENKATTSWRREFIEYAEQHSQFDHKFVVVLPEPKDCDWKSVDYPNLNGMGHVYSQVHWEDHFINLAAKTGILVLHSHFMWAGNAGPTARFEGGKLFSLMKEGKLNASVLNYPKETQSAQYIDSHLLDAKDLYEKGRFEMTQCSPLNLDENSNPIDQNGNKINAGIYPNGASEKGSLYPFFKKIIEMALRLEE